MPAGVIVTVPLIIMALTFQCWIFKGLMAGTSK
jgi:ABC-type glycerol-3-phosphate transport system permease component